MIVLDYTKNNKFLYLEFDSEEELSIIHNLLIIENNKDESEDLLFSVIIDGKCTYYTFFGMGAYLEEKLNLLEYKFTFKKNKLEVPENIKIINNRIINSIPNIELRDYQISAVTKALIYKYGTIIIPTAGGKTLCMFSLIKIINEITFIVVPTITLAEQVYKKAIERGFSEEEFGIITGTKKKISKFNICVAGSLVNMLDKEKYTKIINSTQLLIMDEFQHCQCDTWRRIFDRFVHTKYSIGFTGTLFRTNDHNSNVKDFVSQGIAGKIIYEIDLQYLIDKGYTTEPIIIMKEIYCNVKGKFITYWPVVKKKFIEENYDRNLIISKSIQYLNELNMTTITLVSTKKHAVIISDLLNEEIKEKVIIVFGSSIGMVYNGSEFLNEHIDYNEIVEQLEKGEFRHIIATPVFDEGQDLPSVNAVILGFGGRSFIKLFQSMGRGMRKYIYPNGEEKKYTFIFDFYDSAHPYLKNQSNVRLDAYKDNNIKVMSPDNADKLLISESERIFGINKDESLPTVYNYTPEVLRETNEIKGPRSSMFGIGIEHDPSSFGMTDGPTPNLKDMLDVVPDYDEKPVFIIRFNSDWTDTVLYKWIEENNYWEKVNE